MDNLACLVMSKNSRSLTLYRIRYMDQWTSLDLGQRRDGQFQNSYQDEPQDRTVKKSLQFSLDFHADSSANQMTTASHTSQSKPPFNILLPVTIIGPRIIIAKWICKRNKIINHVTSSFISYNVNQVNTGRSCKPVRCITTTIDFLYFKQGFHSDSFSAI